MANKTLYVKDQDEAVWKEAEELTKESLSSLVTSLLRKEVDRIKNEKKLLSGENKRIVVKTKEEECLPRTVAFNGRWIVDDQEIEDTIYSVAITEKQRFFVLVDGKWGTLYYVYDTLDELKNLAGTGKEYPAELMHWVALGLETDYVEELDI